MRVVVDTNVVLSAFIARGVVADMFMHLIAEHEVLLGDFVRSEVEEKLRARFHYPEHDVAGVLAFLDRVTTRVQAGPLEQPVCRDPDDDNVLAIAAAAAADCVVTGDRDLLVLEEFDEFPILAPRDFWVCLAGR